MAATLSGRRTLTMPPRLVFEQLARVQQAAVDHEVTGLVVMAV
jgi:hypothetical protein